MSMISSPATHRGNSTGIFQTLASTLKGWWVAYIARRMKTAAIAQLRAMSDRELQGIGLTRSDIVCVVTGGRRSRTRPLSLGNIQPESTPP